MISYILMKSTSVAFRWLVQSTKQTSAMRGHRQDVDHRIQILQTECCSIRYCLRLGEMLSTMEKIQVTAFSSVSWVAGTNIRAPPPGGLYLIDSRFLRFCDLRQDAVMLLPAASHLRLNMSPLDINWSTPSARLLCCFEACFGLYVELI